MNSSTSRSPCFLTISTRLMSASIAKHRLTPLRARARCGGCTRMSSARHVMTSWMMVWGEGGRQGESSRPAVVGLRPSPSGLDRWAAEDGAAGALGVAAMAPLLELLWDGGRSIDPARPGYE